MSSTPVWPAFVTTDFTVAMATHRQKLGFGEGQWSSLDTPLMDFVHCGQAAGDSIHQREVIPGMLASTKGPLFTAGLWSQGLALKTALLSAPHTAVQITGATPCPFNPNPFSSHSSVVRNYQVSGLA